MVGEIASKVLVLVRIKPTRILAEKDIDSLGVTLIIIYKLEERTSRRKAESINGMTNYV